MITTKQTAKLTFAPKSASNFIKSAPRMQRGVVLFIAMIALVVMSLAGVALIRSVDTNSLITGNLSFKQTSVISSSYGIESLSDFLGNQPVAFANNDDPTNGYYSVCTTTDNPDNPSVCDGGLLTQSATWQAGTTTRFAEGLEVTNGIDAYGNTIEYIVERMCQNVGPIVTEGCLLARRGTDNGTKNVETEPKVGAPEQTTDIPVYRVTVRVIGPKNTVSYIQSFIS